LDSHVIPGIGIGFERAADMFQINDFKAVGANLSLEGSASISGDRLRLTKDLPQQTAACWYKTKKIDFTDGFESEFTFLISKDDNTQPVGDGFAFVIQAQSVQVTGGAETILVINKFHMELL
jgi:hypothetical protein